MKKILLCFLWVIFVLGMGLPAWAQPADQILRFPLADNPDTLNPFTSETVISGTVLNNIHDGLVAYDFIANDVQPALAERWEQSTNAEGQTIYTFYLRQGVLFHQVEGVTLTDEDREVTAETILWNYELALNSDPEISARAASLTSILGAEAYTSGQAETVAGLQVIDRYTLQMTLAVPDRLFLVNGAGLAITSPAAYAQLGADFGNKPVGTGPFQFVDWKRDESLLLTANPDYWGADAPQLAGIRFLIYPDPALALAAYEADELDILTVLPFGERNQIMADFASEFHEIPSLHVRYFGFNMANGFLAEQPLVRQALNYALDRVTAWDVLGEGARFPADKGMLPPSMPAATPATIYAYDLEKAAQLLAEAGFPNGEGLPVITLKVLDLLEDEPHLALWQSALAELGVTLQFQIETGETYWDSILQEDTMLFINGWAAGLNDPSDVLDYLIMDPTSPLNYQNPQVNEWLQAARLENDPIQRESLYQQAHDAIMADSVLVVSAYGKVTWLQKPWVTGLTPSNAGLHAARLEMVILE